MSAEDRPGRRRDLWDDDTTTSAAPEPATSERSSQGEPAAGATTRRSLHRDRRGRRLPWWIVLVAVLLVAVLCLGGAWAVLGKDEGSAACPEPIAVSAAPEIADPLEDALDKVTGECTDFRVDAASAATVAKNVNEGMAPDVWVPDSSTWIDAIDQDSTPGQWLEGQSIASSPIVLAAGSKAEGAPSEASSWTRVINDKGDLQMANPDVDTASRLAFHASRIGQPSRIGLQTGERLIFLSRFAAPSVNKLLEDYKSDPKANKPFPASEQEIATFNEEHDDLPPLRAVMPEQGTLSLDYPWITNPELKDESLDAADKARTELGSIDVRKSLTAAGFRDANGQRGPAIAGQEAAPVEQLEAPGRNERLALVEQWDIMRTDMRMLAVIDVSGSMQWSSPTPGRTRWDVTQGALTKGTGLLPAGSEVGAWVFSTDRKGGKDYEEVAPVAPMNSEHGDGTHREHLAQLVKDGDKWLGGDTALYDTIWAAHQKMVEDYDPEYVNSIVVFTDGENDDPNGGLSLKQLLDKLDDSYDAQRPVRVITIGMGEADPSALQKIADETGGTSYIAETPEDIERVFVGALLARGSG
ncbi:VWA domain-containing protein [Janibacter cremeus]|uniref:Mg-chelatase subunit ChlD n=1 Tax=Janibacter cremeus TaxID=1285192 RepID=A0A852VRP9_9MICO|nr:VWA domain-containing protein [Janibacter cremeus]NYF98619.1 Mg-chelatase subunit ChlD [Janibacter cremeus]